MKEFASGVGEFLDHSAHNDEYKAAVAGFYLDVPEDYAFPKDAPDGRSDEFVLYERGAGEVAAYLAWLEAVEETIVTSHRANNARRARYWITVAAQFPETTVFKRYNDPNVAISWFDHLIAPAIAGDFTNLEAVVDDRHAQATRTKKETKYA